MYMISFWKSVEIILSFGNNSERALCYELTKLISGSL